MALSRDEEYTIVNADKSVQIAIRGLGDRVWILEGLVVSLQERIKELEKNSHSH